MLAQEDEELQRMDLQQQNLDSAPENALVGQGESGA
jgi:hypothetical protein